MALCLTGGMLLSLQHDDLDARALALHRRVARRLRDDPALFERARATLGRWLETADPATHPYLLTWQALMAQGMAAALAVAEEDSPRARVLRQASPFAGLLSHKERFAVLKHWREQRQHAAS
ncbi:MAG: hypothetical protein Q4G71_12160 [Pseudomonadota bacterium]|nr:hypothetical protein [Pseudomonadota bacterium]